MAKTKATAARSRAASSSTRASSSGERPLSRASSPGSSPKSLVGALDLSGLPTAWDNEPAIRERVRDNNNLCLTYDHDCKVGNGYVDATIENVKLNQAVLLPICKIMKENNLQLPILDHLIEAIDKFFQVAKLPRNPEHCYQEAWSIRRLLNKLKRSTYRVAPPQDCFK